MHEAPTIRQQALAVESAHLEWKDMVERIGRLPIGKGGVDPASLELKRQRVEALRLAAGNMHRWADKVEARGAAE